MVQDQKLLAQRLRDTELRNKFETLTAHKHRYFPDLYPKYVCKSMSLILDKSAEQLETLQYLFRTLLIFWIIIFILLTSDFLMLFLLNSKLGSRAKCLIQNI